MIGAAIICVLGLGVIAPEPAAAADMATPTLVNDEKRAALNWMLNCQGCHGVKGEGSHGGAPDMRGVVGHFLAVDGGREYLSRVPGVANAPLGDAELADLLNWMLLRFDCDAVPGDFVAYAPAEVGALRKDVLITDAGKARERLLEKLADAGRAENRAVANPEGKPCLRN